MGLWVYRFSEYNHTAEREQFRVLCKSLQRKYSDLEDSCIFLGNYTIFDCELDGIIIKNDAIIAIEFKNYGGDIIAKENGDWKLSDGTIIKGGSRKTVYQQAKFNRIAIRDGFREGNIFPQKYLRDITTLIVFNKDIILNNQLSSRVQSWLHITDNSHFIEKIEDVTNNDVYISNKEFVSLKSRLGLDDEYLCTEFSSEIKKTSTDSCGKEVNTTTKDTPGIIIEHECSCPELEVIYSVLQLIFNKTEFVANVFPKETVELLFKEHNVTITKELVVTVECEDIDSYIGVINDALAIKAIQVGKLIVFELNTIDLPQLINGYNRFRCIDMKVTPTELFLPHWLDDFIYTELKANYCPTNADMIVIDWDKSNVLNYLGTYFPRSYAESYSIFNHMLDIDPYFLNRDKITIFDFGCGTGGEIIGLIQALIERSEKLQTIKIIGLDGNKHALRLLEKIIKKTCTKSSILIEYKVIPYIIDDFYDLSILQNIMEGQYDIIMSFKAICEFVTKQRFETDNAYEHIANFMLPKLKKNGVLLLADITTYNNVSQEWLPRMMDLGLSKTNCKVLAKNVGYNQAFFISHSQKNHDVTKIAWRLISNK